MPALAKRMAAHQAPQTKSEPPHWAASPQALYHVLGTGRIKPAARPYSKKRWDKSLILSSQPNKNGVHFFIFFSRVDISSAIPGMSCFLIPLVGLITKSTPRGLGNRVRKFSLTERFIKFLTTARGTLFLLIAAPTRAIPTLFSLLSTTKLEV